MEARGTGSVMEWVVEEDAMRILLSSPSGAVCERSISSCHFGATARGRAGDDVHRDDGAMARGRAPEYGFPPLSLPVRDASRGRRPLRRRGDGTRPGPRDGVSPPLAPSQGCEQGTTMAVPRGYEGDKRIRSILGQADPEQGPL